MGGIRSGAREHVPLKVERTLPLDDHRSGGGQASGNVATLQYLRPRIGKTQSIAPCRRRRGGDGQWRRDQRVQLTQDTASQVLRISRPSSINADLSLPMNTATRTTLALALLALSTGAVFAQQSSLTVYGLLDGSVRVQHTKQETSGAAAGGSVYTTEGGGGFSANGSRLGFRGVEDLGGGLNAHFVLEHGFRADTGSVADPGSFFNRQSFVGLTTPWGAIDVGRQYSVAFKTAVEFDPLLGKYANLDAAVGIVPGSVAAGCLPMMAGACARFNNDVQYTAILNQLTVRAEVSPGEGVSGTSAALGLKYATGPLTVGASLTRQKLLQVAPAPNLPGYPGTPPGAQKLHYVLGASYAFPGIRVLGGASRDTTETNVVDTVFKTSWGGFNWQVNSAVQLTGVFYRSQLRSAVSALRPEPEEKVDALLVEARYALSRRTSVYAEVDRSKWSRGVNFLPTAQPGVVLSGLSLGITHNF